MSNQQLENMKEAFDCNEVVRLHLLEIAQAGDVTEAICTKMGMPRDLVENSAWQIIGHDASQVSLVFCYDYSVAIEWPES